MVGGGWGGRGYIKRIMIGWEGMGGEGRICGRGWERVDAGDWGRDDVWHLGVWDGVTVAMRGKLCGYVRGWSSWERVSFCVWVWW